MRTCTMPIVHGLGTTKFGQITDPRSPFLESVARARGRAVLVLETTAHQHTTPLKPDACGTRAPRSTVEGKKL
jgi:hypothetical protein